jgi:hypothetical protein
MNALPPPWPHIPLPRFDCPRCGMTSHNANDVREGYCGNCHDWTGDPLPFDDQPVTPA